MDSNVYEALLEEYFAEGVEAYIPQVSINCVVFKYEHPTLKVLFHNVTGADKWYLPGGYVKHKESLDQAAYRNLSFSGIEQVYLRQIHTFGEVDRIPKFTISESSGSSRFNKIIEWAGQRFVTIVYYGLVNQTSTIKATGGLFKEVGWIDVNQLDNIGMDHASITAKIKKTLATEILNYPVASSLLKQCFTLNEFRGLFEAVLGRNIDRGTFRRKIMKLGIVEQVDKIKDTVGRPSYLYRFDQEAYNRLLKKETKFGF